MIRRGLKKKKSYNFFRNNKGLSPVIATVLLVAMVVVMGAIVFVWFKGFVGESTLKFNKNIALACNDVQFTASYTQGVLSITNTGNVPIYDFMINVGSSGGYNTQDLKTISSATWPIEGLNDGGLFSQNIGSSPPISQATSMTVIPVLRGVSQSGVYSTQTCPAAQGYKVL